MLSTERSLFRFIVLSLPFFGSVLARGPCYWPDGSKVTVPHEACQDNDSSCCFDREICLSNNLCFAPSLGLVSYLLPFLWKAADKVLRFVLGISRCLYSSRLEDTCLPEAMH